MMPEIAIAIVGAGPVGILLACELAERGVAVAVFERRAEPSMQSRAIGIHPPSLAILERIGAADALLDRAAHIESGEVWVDGRRLGALSFSEAGGRPPYVAAVPQYETEAILRARLEALQPGALRTGVAVQQLHQSADEVEIHTDAEAGPVRAKYLVAADGARSTVRELCGIGWHQIGRTRSYLMADFADPESTGDGETRLRAAMLYFERGGVVESFPLPGGLRRWVAMSDRLWPDAPRAELAAIICARTGVELEAGAGQASAFLARQHLAERMVRGRVVLIGDAAHELSPIGGQGMNLGWLDAAALAPVLVRAVNASGPDQSRAASEALLEWQRRRQQSARLAVRQAGFNMVMGDPRRGPGLLARNALVRSLTLPPSRRLLAKAFTMRWL